MPDYLTSAEYPAIRAAIDISMDVSNLPDDVIGLSIYEQEAERWVAIVHPLSDTYAAGTVEFRTVQTAAIYACAALVAPAVPTLTGETYEDGYRYTRDKVDTGALQLALWERARAALQTLMEVSSGDSKPPRRFIFTRACGARGQL